MAKLKAPLLSLGASGALGKAVVFFPWKGIDAVREYVVPTNPQSPGQTTQRGYLTDAVAAIHAAEALAVNPLDTDDQIALSALGSTHPTPRTWFNEQVKLWNDTMVFGTVPVIYSNGTTTTASRVAIDLALAMTQDTSPTLAAGTFYMGKSKTNLIHAYTAVLTSAILLNLAAEDISAWAAVGDKIYWQFRPDVADGCEKANSGIYSFVAEA